jgi:enoyl-[acyl-carrier protein] reductase I
MPFLQGKRFLITGVASERSIATGIATAMHRQGAELAFTYQNEKLRGRVQKLAETLGTDANMCFKCDVAHDSDIEQLARSLGDVWPGMDGLVHAIGFAPIDQLNGSVLACTTRKGFQIAHDISVYSLIALSAALRPRLNPGSALLTLSYHGAHQAIPNYNVMGMAKASLEASVRYLASDLGPDNIRVNAISAGPIRTLAASGIKHFRKMLKASAEMAPLRRTVTTEEVGNVAAFLCSDMASGITGEVTYVDAGLNISGMAPVEQIP